MKQWRGKDKQYKHKGVASQITLVLFVTQIVTKSRIQLFLKSEYDKGPVALLVPTDSPLDLHNANIVKIMTIFVEATIDKATIVEITVVTATIVKATVIKATVFMVTTIKAVILATTTVIGATVFVATIIGGRGRTIYAWGGPR